MTVEQMKRDALAEGFAKAEVVDTSSIPFDVSFRKFCNGEQCKRYGNNYTCPPHCDAPEAMKARIMAHQKALVVQSLVESPEQMTMEDYRQAEQKHNRGIMHLAEKFRAKGCLGFMVEPAAVPCAAPAQSQGKNPAASRKSGFRGCRPIVCSSGSWQNNAAWIMTGSRDGSLFLECIFLSKQVEEHKNEDL